MSIFNGGCGPCNRIPYTNIHDINLDWVLCTVKQLDQGFDALQEEVTTKLSEMGASIEEIQNWIKQFEPEEFVQLVENTVNKYLAIGVYFGLTDDGYFVATYPSTWSAVQFGTTGKDVFPSCQPEYGHLTLSY